MESASHSGETNAINLFANDWWVVEREREREREGESSAWNFTKWSGSVVAYAQKETIEQGARYSLRWLDELKELEFLMHAP